MIWWLSVGKKESTSLPQVNCLLTSLSCSLIYIYVIYIFWFIVPEDKYERVQRMIHDIYFWALDAGVDDFFTDRVNLIVISNDIQGESNLVISNDIQIKINLVSSIQHMALRGCHTFLLQPAVHIPSGKPQSSVWQGCLLNGGVSSEPCTRPRHFTNLLKRKSSLDTDSQD